MSTSQEHKGTPDGELQTRQGMPGARMRSRNKKDLSGTSWKLPRDPRNLGGDLQEGLPGGPISLACLVCLAHREHETSWNPSLVV